MRVGDLLDRCSPLMIAQKKGSDLVGARTSCLTRWSRDALKAAGDTVEFSGQICADVVDCGDDRKGDASCDLAFGGALMPWKSLKTLDALHCE
jgi:hypothetical protein